MCAGVNFLVGIERQPRANNIVTAVLRHFHSVAHDAVQGHEMLVRVLVVPEPPGLGVERHALAEAVRVVHQVPGHAAVVRVVHVAVGHAWVIGPAGSNEAAPVTARCHLPVGYR